MEERMLGAADVMRRLKVSRSYAYKLIHRLNEEMAAAGNITETVTEAIDDLDELADLDF